MTEQLNEALKLLISKSNEMLEELEEMKIKFTEEIVKNENN